MQIIFVIAAIALGLLLMIFISRFVEFRITKRKNERFLKNQICTGSLGLRRYNEDGSYKGAKTTILTDLAIKDYLEISERSEKEEK